MIIHREKEKPFSAHKCTKPKFRDHRGRTWDSQLVVVNKTKMVDFIYDTSRGTAYYFEWNGQWYKAPFHKGKFPVDDNASPELTYREELTIKE